MESRESRTKREKNKFSGDSLELKNDAVKNNSCTPHMVEQISLLLCDSTWVITCMCMCIGCC